MGVLFSRGVLSLVFQWLWGCRVIYLSSLSAIDVFGYVRVHHTQRTHDSSRVLHVTSSLPLVS